jgi:MFS family permease
MTMQSITGSDAVRAFRHRNYRLFFSGQAVSLVGSWMQSVAQAWLVLTLTNDPLILGVVAAAQWTPVLFLGLFGGLIADTLPKRWTLIVCESTLAALALILGVLTLTGMVQVWMILVLAVLLGCVNAIEMPVRQAFAVEMVGREDVVNAVILNSALFNSARVVGPAVAGLTIAATNTGVAFLINGASFLAVIVGLLMMRDSELRSPPPMRRPHTAREVVASVGEGVSYVRQTPVVLYSVVVVGLAATIGMNFQVTIPPFARATLGGGPADFGFLMTATGLGSVAAALWLAGRRRPSPWLIPSGAALLGAALILIAVLPRIAVALPALTLAGFGAIGMAATGNTTIQTVVPDELRGRVMSVYTTVFAGSTPIGAIFAGAIASAANPVASLAAGGVGTLAVGLLGLAWLRRNREVADLTPRVAAAAGTTAAAGRAQPLDTDPSPGVR